MPVDIEKILRIAREAGEAILSIYNDPEKSGEVSFKSDSSPLTLADEASNDVIQRGLSALTPDIPVLSEEGRQIPYAVRKDWVSFWCVDPLDGTKEFVKRNGEFTVNIALIRNGIPVLGVIYVPVTNTMYYAGERIGAWKVNSGGERSVLKVNRIESAWTAVGSRTHSSPEEHDVLSAYPVVSTVYVGSSLKFCLIADGQAQIYYRQGPTMEWDTAAGQAILTLSGGKMTKLSGEPFLYNKSSLLNGSFICSAQHLTLRDE